jgi:hypothetical protein
MKGASPTTMKYSPEEQMWFIILMIGILVVAYTIIYKF